MQEIFNKVEQNQLQRTKNVGNFLDATETLSISAEALAAGPKWVVGHHPLVNSSGAPRARFAEPHC